MSAPDARRKTVCVALDADVYAGLTYHCRRYEMPPRAFLAHLAEQYIAAMDAAEKGGNQGR